MKNLTPANEVADYNMCKNFELEVRELLKKKINWKKAVLTYTKYVDTEDSCCRCADYEEDYYDNPKMFYRPYINKIKITPKLMELIGSLRKRTQCLQNMKDTFETTFWDLMKHHLRYVKTITTYDEVSAKKYIKEKKGK